MQKMDWFEGQALGCCIQVPVLWFQTSIPFTFCFSHHSFSHLSVDLLFVMAFPWLTEGIRASELIEYHTILNRTCIKRKLYFMVTATLPCSTSFEIELWFEIWWTILRWSTRDVGSPVERHPCKLSPLKIEGLGTDPWHEGKDILKATQNKYHSVFHSHFCAIQYCDLNSTSAERIQILL